MATKKEDLGDVLERLLVSPNVSDSNGEAANVVDALDKIARGLFAVAGAIRETANERKMQ